MGGGGLGDFTTGSGLELLLSSELLSELELLELEELLDRLSGDPQELPGLLFTGEQLRLLLSSLFLSTGSFGASSGVSGLFSRLWDLH